MPRRKMLLIFLKVSLNRLSDGRFRYSARLLKSTRGAVDAPSSALK